MAGRACPILTAGMASTRDTATAPEPVVCIEEHCAWWTRTEGCAVAALPKLLGEQLRASVRKVS